MKTLTRPFMTALVLLIASVAAGSRATVKVVTTLQDYAAIAREVGGDRVEVQAIVAGNADAHFIKPKPSYALMLKDADLFVSTGLDLELWAPVLVNKAGNRRDRRRCAGLRRGGARHRAARRAHVARPLGGRHPHLRQPAHPDLAAQRGRSSPATSPPGCARSMPPAASSTVPTPPLSVTGSRGDCTATTSSTCSAATLSILSPARAG